MMKKLSILIESISERIEDKIRHKRAELEIERGRNFKENFLQLLKEEAEKKIAANDTSNSFALAYRKKTDNTSDPDDSEAKMMELIRKAKEKD